MTFYPLNLWFHLTWSSSPSAERQDESCASIRCCRCSVALSSDAQRFSGCCCRIGGFGVWGTTRCRRVIPCRSISSGKASRLASTQPTRDQMANLSSSKVGRKRRGQTFAFFLSLFNINTSQLLPGTRTAVSWVQIYIYIHRRTVKLVHQLIIVCHFRGIIKNIYIWLNSVQTVCKL